MSHLTTAPLELGRLVTRVSAPGRGGIACFLGVVRDQQGGRAVARLDYSAYEPMAEAECERIVTEARGRWNAEVALEHRLGRLEIGEAAVAIAAAAAHRDAAFAACRYAIEQVKQRVPIWKREEYVDGGVEWVNPQAVGRPDGPTAGVPEPATQTEWGV
ncbi:MAG TPA: molybdenum cofactor biosynthesis protein MoaE [Gemmatimonadales bacterium]|nr:molybdenum cofactor biosynthesis protein MoaE [Gemmatimonadales bacterium]